MSIEAKLSLLSKLIRRISKRSIRQAEDYRKMVVRSLTGAERELAEKYGLLETIG